MKLQRNHCPNFSWTGTGSQRILCSFSLKVNHGGPKDETRHVGDLGNIMADANGSARVYISDYRITLCGPNSIIGRAVVIHSGPDDFGRGGTPDSLKTGNAGSRIGCGLIGIL